MCFRFSAAMPQPLSATRMRTVSADCRRATVTRPPGCASLHRVEQQVDQRVLQFGLVGANVHGSAGCADLHAARNARARWARSGGRRPRSRAPTSIDVAAEPGCPRDMRRKCCVMPAAAQHLLARDGGVVADRSCRVGACRAGCPRRTSAPSRAACSARARTRTPALPSDASRCDSARCASAARRSEMSRQTSTTCGQPAAGIENRRRVDFLPRHRAFRRAPLANPHLPLAVRQAGQRRAIGHRASAGADSLHIAAEHHVARSARRAAGTHRWPR